MTEAWTVRKAKPADLDAALKLLAKARLPTADLDIAHLALAAEQDGAVAGLIGLETFSDLGLLRSLVVDPSCRGGGLGCALVTELEILARKQGVVELWLLTVDADEFFSSLGYVRESREHAPDAIRGTQEFSNLCPGDAVLMRKRLLKNIIGPASN